MPLHQSSINPPPPPSPQGSGMRRVRAAHSGEWKEWSFGVCPEGGRGQKSWQACGQMSKGAVMQRGFSGIMTELSELKCQIHITCTEASQISGHLHQNELKIINLGGRHGVQRENGLLSRSAEETLSSKVLYRLRYSG